MKRFLALTLSLVMVLALFSGCQKTEVPPKEGEKPVEKTDPKTPAKVRTDIIIGVTADVVSPDPHNQNDTSSGRVLHMIFDPLIRMDKDGKTFLPALAEKWEKVSDTEYTFTLRKDVKFHNGATFDAKDAKFSIERCMASTKTAQTTDAIKEVKILDDYKISVITKTPFAPFLFNMSSSKLSMLDEETTTAAGDTFKTKPIGTGPMKFVSWAPNDNFKVARNDEYWDFKPETTSITIRVIPEPTSLTIMLETGEVDIVEGIASVDIKRIKANADIKTVDQVQGSVSYLGMNYLSKPFDNLDLRKAIAHAINRDSMIEVILEGYGKPLNTIFPPMMPGYDGSLNLYPYDVEKAKALLAKSGIPSGLTLELAVSGDERNRIAQLIQSDLKKVGIDVKIELLEWGAFLDHVGGKTHEMFILGWSNAYNPDGSLFDTFHKDRPANTNRSHYKNAAVSKKIEESRQELDEKKRLVTYKELQAEIMSDPVWIPLFAKTQVVGMNKNTSGLELEPITEYTYVHTVINE